MPGRLRAYLRAKGAADADVRARAALDWTILRPGRLTNDPGAGRVTLSESTGRAEVTRDDVAATPAALLDEPATAGPDAGTDRRGHTGGGGGTGRGRGELTPRRSRCAASAIGANRRGLPWRGPVH